MPTVSTATTVIDDLTFERPFRSDRRYISLGIPLGTWIVSFNRDDGTGGLTVPDQRVFDAFGINPDEEN